MNESKTLAEARQFVQEGREHKDGVVCPCCEQRAKIYKRKLNAKMVLALIDLVDLYLSQDTRDWINIHDVKKIQGRPGGGDFAKLRYFDLIVEKERDPEADGDQRSSGYWKPTKKGHLFVLGKWTVPEAVFLYDEKLVREAERETDVRTALGKQYSYAEVMAATRGLGV